MLKIAPEILQSGDYLNANFTVKTNGYPNHHRVDPTQLDGSNSMAHDIDVRKEMVGVSIEDVRRCS